MIFLQAEGFTLSARGHAEGRASERPRPEKPGAGGARLLQSMCSRSVFGVSYRTSLHWGTREIWEEQFQGSVSASLWLVSS